ncbi:type VII toxin-antitoxin system HepT family RNase toxin [Desulfoscipio geothermicus]|uniref:Uncharacterized conserved protein YutE, UPF0331/DUF86 family n=1 Tax=Desulfoscipio geothermicus DSM 3669 TaxID=1121426 RepID=A0A1I6E6U4_9FIRM|nr:DUF86 domain-containing protein [Desulfoscipio geothermicus]SFR13469.1 Uncharacterized conserved protein YutE, UPF0331/DUF86 family [Desulfoscipio geothermicus DSM 3669]
MDTRILEHIKLLDKYLSYLESFTKVAKEDYLSDITIQGATERYLQLSIESCLNIGGRVLSLNQDAPELAAPCNYADIFIKLGKLGVMPESFAGRLVHMAKFRNKLVHGYWEIDKERVFQILHEDLKDIYKFREYIIKYLAKKN